MGRVRADIKIKLMSDLCVSSGQAFAGIVDADVCMNQNGFPYIPAKRLKGILREAAELLGYSKEKIDAYFGCGGNGFDDISYETVYLEDAYLEKTDGIDNVITDIKQDKAYACMSEQNILGIFSNIKAQTAISKNGIADDRSLRFTRVVNQYYPNCIDTNQSEMVFVAPIEFYSEQENDIARIITAVRHIGMDRNRGFGNVRCSLDKESQRVLDIAELSQDGESDRKVVIKYILKNTSPLLLSSSKDAESEQYIGGQMILGAIAGLYMKEKKLSEPDSIFKDLFLSGDTIFSNLYITDRGHQEYIPAPLFINRLKKTKKYVCVLKDSVGAPKEYNPEDGNQPKKLNGKYIVWDNNSISAIEPKLDLFYHHSKKETFDLNRMGEDNSDGVLYSAEVLEKGQLFSGEIIIKEKYARLMRNILKSNMLRLGKSKTSQYGSCVCESIEENKPYNINEYDLDEGEKIMVVFESDTVIPGRYGYTIDYNEVQEYIAQRLGLRTIENPKVYIKSKVVTGYNSKINLKRASIPALAAGSAFEFEVPAIGKYIVDFIGGYNSEGFGKVRIVKENSLVYQMEEVKSDVSAEHKATPEIDKMRLAICREKVLEEVKVNFIDNIAKQNINVSSSLIGRVTLMLKESDERDRLMDFAKRVMAIKRDKERMEIVSRLKAWNICTINKSGNDIRVENLFTIQSLRDSGIVDYDLLDVVSADENGIMDLWHEYLAFILLHLKYLKSAENKADRTKKA